jgi:hypothetical protein
MFVQNLNDVVAVTTATELNDAPLSVSRYASGYSFALSFTGTTILCGKRYPLRPSANTSLYLFLV